MLCGTYRLTRIRCGRVTENIITTRTHYENPTVKLSREYYVIKNSGELKNYSTKISVSRAENLGHVVRSVNRLRQLINANEVIGSTFWVTLTYAENMTDTERLYNDFKKFWQRFKRWCVNRGYNQPEYICCVEPQKRGAWHIHALFIWYDNTCPRFISNKELYNLWDNGFVNIQRPTKLKNLGAYVSTYLTCTKGKKNERLFMYPAGIQIYRYSRGVRKPEKTIDIVQNFEFSVDNCGSLAYSDVRFFYDDDGNIVNTVYRWQTIDSTIDVNLL